MATFYDNIIFTQRQISATLAEMSDLSLLWKLRKNSSDNPMGISLFSSMYQSFQAWFLTMAMVIHWSFPQMFSLDALISEHHDVIIGWKIELASFLQMSVGDFVKLSDVMGFSQGVQKYLARWVNNTNEDRRWRLSCKCRNECHHWIQWQKNCHHSKIARTSHLLFETRKLPQHQQDTCERQDL